MIPGILIWMADKEWQIPPLTLGQLRRLMPKINQVKNLTANMAMEELDTITEVVLAAMQRNYPDLTAESVEELLDIGNAAEVLTAILTGSGLRKSGEPGAVSNGAISMDSSPPPADIPIQPLMQ